MTTLKTVEEVVEQSGQIDEAIDFSPTARVMHLPFVKKLITQDRANTLAVLREKFDYYGNDYEHIAVTKLVEILQETLGEGKEINSILKE